MNINPGGWWEVDDPIMGRREWERGFLTVSLRDSWTYLFPRKDFGTAKGENES